MILTFTRRDPDQDSREFLPPLTWTIGKFGPANRPFVVTICAAGHSHIVGIAGTMSADGTLQPPAHSIAPDGTISPSYVCPRAGCQFHEYVRLEGWTGKLE